MEIKKTVTHKGLLILDFGSQYTLLIARRLREGGVYSHIHGHKSSTLPPNSNWWGIILSGSPQSTESSYPQTKELLSWVFQQNCPVLGICYGLQAMAKWFGGQVQTGSNSSKHKIQTSPNRSK